jgi:hypothetical protein
VDWFEERLKAPERGFARSAYLQVEETKAQKQADCLTFIGLTSFAGSSCDFVAVVERRRQRARHLAAADSHQHAAGKRTTRLRFGRSENSVKRTKRRLLILKVCLGGCRCLEAEPRRARSGEKRGKYVFLLNFFLFR